MPNSRATEVETHVIEIMGGVRLMKGGTDIFIFIKNEGYLSFESLRSSFGLEL